MNTVSIVQARGQQGTNHPILRTVLNMGCAASTQGLPKEQEVTGGPSEELEVQKKEEEEARESQRQVWNT